MLIREKAACKNWTELNQIQTGWQESFQKNLLAMANKINTVDLK